MINVQTGNMLDVVVEGKSLGLKPRGSNEVWWLPEPEGLRDVLTAEINRLKPAATPTPVSLAAREAAEEFGWLLEKMHNGNVHYISADYVLQWTDDPNKALRLARKEDAEALCTIVEDCEKIAEHKPSQPPSCAFCDSGLVFNEQELAALSELYERTGLSTAKVLKHALALYQLHVARYCSPVTAAGGDEIPEWSQEHRDHPLDGPD